jgi:flagellar operon protein
MGINELKSVLKSRSADRVRGNDFNTNKSQNVEDFKNLLKKRVEKEVSDTGIKLSGHARKRLEERNLTFDGQEFLKIKEAIGKLKEKGGHDSLVVTDKAAYIVDVDKQTVVTAIDKNEMSENVFTKIDSTYFIN